MGKTRAHLTTLPELVVENLLKYLAVEALLYLRLTCKTTKAWIEQLHVLKRLQVTIKTEDVFNEIAKSNTTVQWSNFKFSWDTVFKKPKLLQIFLKKLGPSIRVFDFSNCAIDDHCTRNDTIVDIILACPSLTSLRIFELSCAQITRRKNGLQTIKSNWKGLKYLEIKQMLCTDYHGVEYFGEMLHSCSSLDELNPPLIAISSPEYLSFNYKMYFKNYVIQPIISYLKSRPASYNLRKLYVEEYLFDGEPQLLFELAETCYNSKTILYPKTFLPFSRSLFDQVPEVDAYLFQVLGSLSGINDFILGISGKQTLKNLGFLSVSFRSFWVSDEILDSYEVPLLLLPNLKEVEMEITNGSSGDGSPYKLTRFIRKFCSTTRPTVEKLNLIAKANGVDTTIIRAVDIVMGFPNLTKLEVGNWDAENSQFLILWMGLERLEEVHLRYCQNLNDDGVIGDDDLNPIMLRLKNLKVLILSDVGCISDRSFVYVFKFLTLKKFYHHTSSGSTVTRVGYNALAKGPFRDSIQEMMIQCSSEFKQMDKFCTFLQQFPKLRKPQFEDVPFHHPMGNERRFPFNLHSSSMYYSPSSVRHLDHNPSIPPRSCCSVS